MANYPVQLDQLEGYLDSLVPERTDELQEMEAIALQTGFPIVGPASGQFCYLIARLANAQRVFELGSGYGYSTAWFARAVTENIAHGATRKNGKEGSEPAVHHTVWDEQLSKRARRHLGALGYAPAEEGGIMHYRVAEAVQALRETPGPFDLIFNDIDKHAYPESLPVIHEKLRPGGILIVDNLLWHGQILDPTDRERDTQAIRAFTQEITTSPDWIASLVPIRDGLMVAYKK